MLVRVIDLAAHQDPADSRTKVRDGRTVLRDPQTVTGVTIHQTACRYDVGRRLMLEAGGDRGMARALRVVRGVGVNPGVPAHAIALRDGVIVRAFDLRAYCYHANGLNASTLGLEIEGVYSGLEDDPATLPDEARQTTPGRDDCDELDALTIATAREALRRLVAEGRALGMPLEYVWAHRQSSASRRADPGVGLWRSVVEEYALSELGLEARYDVVLGDGRPIPREWAAAARAKY